MHEIHKHCTCVHNEHTNKIKNQRKVFILLFCSTAKISETCFVVDFDVDHIRLKQARNSMIIHYFVHLLQTFVSCQMLLLFENKIKTIIVQKLRHITEVS